MAIKKQDLLKFSKAVEFAIKLVEDDSSDNTEVKILHLAEKVTATGSIPTAEGLPMKVTSDKIYVAAENIDKMLENLEEKDGVLVYNGSMHLDVSKPKGRNQNGQFVITTPAKIWLVSTKYSRSGGNLRQDGVNNLNTLINKMFASGTPVDLTAETAAATATSTPKPEVVPNQGQPEEGEKAIKNGAGKAGASKTTA